MVSRKFFCLFLLLPVLQLASTQSSESFQLLDLFRNAFGGSDGQNLLNRFINLLSGGRGSNFESESLGSFFRDSVFDNLVKKAYELNTGLIQLQRSTRDFAYDMDRIKNILDRGGSATQILSTLRRSDNFPESMSAALSQNRVVDQLNSNFTKFINGMRALRAAFSNEEGLGDTLKELVSQSGATGAQGQGSSVGQAFGRFLRILKGEQSLGDLSFRQLGLCSTTEQCQKMQRGLQDLKRIFDVLKPKPEARPSSARPGNRFGQQKLSERSIKTELTSELDDYYNFY